MYKSKEGMFENKNWHNQKKAESLLDLRYLLYDLRQSIVKLLFDFLYDVQNLYLFGCQYLIISIEKIGMRRKEGQFLRLVGLSFPRLLNCSLLCIDFLRTLFLICIFILPIIY